MEYQEVIETDDSDDNEQDVETSPSDFDVEDNQSFKLYVAFVLLRILLALLPQSGYIHPDELIQSVEVVAGHILNAEAQIAWEFNHLNPIRSLNIPFLINGTPIWILKKVSQVTEQVLNVNLITPYSILISSRSILCAGSFLVDLSLYKICVLYSRPYQHKLTVLATSYVMLVYGTHTFSNTVELILFSVLLWMIANCLYDHQLLVRFRKYLVDTTNGLDSVISRVRHMKVLRSIQELNLHHCFLISSLIVAGCYNRPTFVVFGVGPVFFWIHRGLSFKHITVRDIHTRMLMFLLSALPLIITFVLSDSFYYGYLTIAEIYNLDVSIKNFVFPPWNFIKYNLNSDNLAKYGLHARYLHFLVNFPLLFGVLAIIMFVSWAAALLRFVKKPSLGGHSRALDIDNLMRVSLIVPVTLLSLLPHQEPRFIIPIILPLIFLYGDLVYHPPIKLMHLSKQLLNIWLVFNIVLTAVFGFLHQGGVYNLAMHMHQELSRTPVNTTVHLITSHMYNFPHVLLNQPNPNTMFRSTDGVRYQKRKQVYYYEQRSQAVVDVIDKITYVYNLNSNVQVNGQVQPFTIYVAMPALLSAQFQRVFNHTYRCNGYEMVTLFPHLSTEVFDKSEALLLPDNGSVTQSTFSLVCKVVDSLSLHVYQFKQNQLHNYAF